MTNFEIFIDTEIVKNSYFYHTFLNILTVTIEISSSTLSYDERRFVEISDSNIVFSH